MKLKDTKERTNLVELPGHDFRISNSNQAVIMKMLSEHFYSNPIQAIVQEYTSNCWDSHVEAGKTDTAIRIQLKKDGTGKWFISFDDFGMGLSPERVKEVFTVYFESTKRDSNDEIGAYGLGSKSGYAYQDTFFIDTWHDGTLYQYMMTKTELGLSRLELLGKKDTDRQNGTSVWFYLKDKVRNGSYRSYDNKPADLNSFKSAIKKKCGYFDNLYFDIEESEDFNDLKIYRGKYFTYSELAASAYAQAHILLGQVPYQVDYSSLGISSTTVPIAVNFSIGELQPSPSRETIVYTDEAKKLIIERFRLAAEELGKLVTEEIDIQGKTAQQIYEAMKHQYGIWLTDEVCVQTGLDFVRTYSGHRNKGILKIKGLDVIKQSKKIIELAYSYIYCNRRIGSRLLATKDGSYYWSIKRILENNTCMFCEGDYNRLKTAFIADSYVEDVYLIKRRKVERSKAFDERITEAYGIKEKRIDKFVEELEWIISQMLSTLIVYDNITPTPEFIASRKKKKEKRESSVFTIYKGRRREQWDDRAATFDSHSVRLEDLRKEHTFFIYGSKAQLLDLDNIYALDTQNVTVFYCNTKYHPMLEKLDNAMSYEDFLKGKNRAFKRVVSAYMIDQFLNDHFLNNLTYKWFFGYRKFIRDINNDLADKMVFLEKYLEKYQPGYNGKRYCNMNDQTKEFLNACKDLAIKHKLYDHEVYHTINEVKKKSDKLSFITNIEPLDETTLSMVVNYIKKVTQDFRMDLKHYQHEKEEDRCE